MADTVPQAVVSSSPLFLGQDGEFWDFLVILSGVVAAAAAIFVGLATAGSVIVHKREASAAEIVLQEFKLTTARDLAEFQAQTASANVKAAEAMLELERIKVPRTLNPERQRLVSEALAPFASQRFSAAISQGADDGLAFWESLHAALTSAGWVYLGPGSLGVGTPPAGIPIAAIPGIEIRIYPRNKERLLPAALALGNSLHMDGTVVAVNMYPQDTTDEEFLDVIQVVIGARVPPIR